MDYINECFNTKITKIKLLYSRDDIYGYLKDDIYCEEACVFIYDNFKFYDKNNIKINILQVMSDWETNKQTRNKQYMISRFIDKMNIDKQLTEYNCKIKSTFLNILK